MSPGVKGVRIYSKLCIPSCFVSSFPSKENLGDPTLSLSLDLISGAGMAAKFPDPEISKVSFTGSPRETRSVSSLEIEVKDPMAP